MAVIINELEVVLDPEAGATQPGAPQPGTPAAATDKPKLGPQDLMAMLDRECRNQLRLMAH